MPEFKEAVPSRHETTEAILSKMVYKRYEMNKVLGILNKRTSLFHILALCVQEHLISGLQRLTVERNHLWPFGHCHSCTAATRRPRSIDGRARSTASYLPIPERARAYCRDLFDRRRCHLGTVARMEFVKPAATVRLTPSQ